MPTYSDQFGPGKTGDGCITLSEGTVEFPEGCSIKLNDDIRGVATVANGETTEAVLFGNELAAAPLVIMLTPQDDPGDSYWVTAISATGFTINVGTAVGADTDFMWIALR